MDDRKGLETLILAALLTLNDFNQDKHDRPGSGGASMRRKSSSTSAPASPQLPNEPPPPLPLRPPPPAEKTGLDKIAELQAVQSEPNEVRVEDAGMTDDYAQYCYNLLQDDAMLFITVASAEAANVPKVLQVVEETKRLRYKNGETLEMKLFELCMIVFQVLKRSNHFTNMSFMTRPRKDLDASILIFRRPKNRMSHHRVFRSI